MAGSLVQACVCLWILITVACRIPESQVTCTFSQDCVLPCTFKPATNTNISWYRQEVPILKFWLSAGLEDLLAPNYVNRISLFDGQVSHGNASLQLKQTSTQDQGKYLCSVTTDLGIEESIVTLRVEAPIRSVTLAMSSDSQAVECSSRDIYPAPHLSWSTEPPLEQDTLRPTTRKSADRLGLYSVESKLDRPKNSTGYTYTCTISTSTGSQTWSAALRDGEMRPTEDNQMTIPCFAPRDMKNFSLTWNFTRQGQSTVILTFDSWTWRVSSHWGEQARVDLEQAGSGDGSLHLKVLNSTAQTGQYVCMFSTARTRYLMYTSVNVSGVSGLKVPSERRLKGKESRLWLISIVIAAIALCIGTVWCMKKKDGTSHVVTDAAAAEMQPIKADHTENSPPLESCPFSVDKTNIN